MELLKVHGSQNRFFLLDQATLPQPLPQADLVDLAKRLCTDPALGGADGLLVVSPAEHAAGRMTVVNADGSIAKMCGNGLRTVARYLSEKTGQDDFNVQTEESVLHVSRKPDLAAGVPAFGVEIAPISFTPASLPFADLGVDRILDTPLPKLAPQLRFTAIAVPNPHLIAFGDASILADEPLGALGKRLNSSNPYFPEGVNVTFATVLADHKLFARTYERGVGFTNACGTGTAATSLAFLLTQPNQTEVGAVNTVYNPGGMVQTIVHQTGQTYWVELIGNATVTAHVTLANGQAQLTPTHEDQAYQRFVQALPYRDLVAVRA